MGHPEHVVVVPESPHAIFKVGFQEVGGIPEAGMALGASVGRRSAVPSRHVCWVPAAAVPGPKHFLQVMRLTGE